MGVRRSLVAVVIPFYKEQLSSYEKISFQQCRSVLSQYTVIAIKPKRLSNAYIPREVDEIIEFHDHYFDGIEGYNRLMMSDDFYNVFAPLTEFILIHQLDAFVFKDELAYWCKSGYDYIGAPWPPELPYPDLVKATKMAFLKRIYRFFDIQNKDQTSIHRVQIENGVGNGGFSLRKVDKFLHIAKREKQAIEKYLSKMEDHHFNEDVFWSIEVNRKIRQLNIPAASIARKFSIENHPERLFKENGSVLPFGCHAWDKHIDFWRSIFEENFGYRV
ncbi:hypothetical protein GCM10023231_06190 [Olivibacter ginsenosidimutans]|uniref:DUF5672 domain-containing protein n=1 Tax=Olivibacter ginsenosidimutans TaxID=1176537 RepID=A0ABP9AIJ9_9SPHI